MADRLPGCDEPRTSVVLRWQPDRRQCGLGSHDGPDDVRPVAVVFGVVRRVDAGLSVWRGVGEDDIPLDTARANASGTTRCGADEPRIRRTVGGTAVDVMARPHHPDRDVGAQRAVCPAGRYLQ